DTAAPGALGVRLPDVFRAAILARSRTGAGTRRIRVAAAGARRAGAVPAGLVATVVVAIAHAGDLAAVVHARTHPALIGAGRRTRGDDVGAVGWPVGALIAVLVVRPRTVGTRPDAGLGRHRVGGIRGGRRQPSRPVDPLVVGIVGGAAIDVHGERYDGDV